MIDIKIHSQRQGKSQGRSPLSLSLSLSLSRERWRSRGLAASQTGFSALGLIVTVFILISLVVGGFSMVNRSSTSTKLHSLQSQVDGLEQKATSGNLSAEDINTLDNLKTDVANLQTKTKDLPADTATQLSDLTQRLVTLESNTSITGAKGATGAQGAKGDTGNIGFTGATGLQGLSGVASCPNGNCLSLQATSPGIQETGNINISGTAKAGSFSGNGAGVTNVDASYLSGFNASYFVNASNISSGTVADARLTTNVTLQGNTFNGISQLVKTTAGGILPILSGANLTNLNGTNITSGTVADARLSANVPLLNATQTFTGANTFSSASNSFTGNGAGLTSLNGTNISSGTVADLRLTTNVTLQGNTFNGVSQLVQTTAGGILPVLSGANLTSLNGTNISSGTVSNTYLVNAGALTVTAGTGLAGGGAVALGGVITLTNSGVLSVTGTANQITVSASTGAVTFSLPQNIAVSSSPTFAGLTISGNTTVTGSITAGSYTRSCPTGYVPVPGNPRFGTSDFCVMKYDASNDGAGNAVSVPNAAPWVSITQTSAEDTSRATGGHLLTEAEWMTIATNALWVNANWCNADGSLCGNIPGTAGKILAAGHNDNSPAQALTASSTDSQACYGTITAGTDTTCGSVAGTQKRTLTLSNGSVIWDFGGNVWQWTNSWIIGNEQPTVTATPGFGWREYTALTRYGALNYANPTNRGWNSTQGLGQIYSDGTSTNLTLYGFIRGGDWADGSLAGAFSLRLNYTPASTDTYLGFRVAR